MAVQPQPNLVNELIRRLDEAVTQQQVHGCCQAVKVALEEIVASGEDFIDPHFLQPAKDKYARRLLHKDPEGRYTALVMVWDVGQGTALHDHDEMWCVECVYRGRIRVTSYSKDSQDNELYQFTKEKQVYAGVAEAGALIPPFEYHVLENDAETPSVTLHIYGGEMTKCHVFLPTEDGYVREERQLGYTD